MCSAVGIPVIYGGEDVKFFGTDYMNDSISTLAPLRILVEWILPMVATILFWVHRAATPGKMALSLKVLDAETGEPVTTGQGIGRYFAYFISMIPLFLGFIWIAFDDRKQGWHDKFASTVVVKDKAGSIKPVEFTNR